MIVSYHHNFIFVKTRKTAGTSMEIALASHAGENDVVTTLTRQDEFLRADMYPGALPRNFLNDPSLEDSYIRAIHARDREAADAIAAEFKDSKMRRFHNHISATRARGELDGKFWDAAFKFTIERDPYEKAVSLAWFRTRFDDRPFPEILDQAVASHGYRNFQRYTVDGEVAVDFIIRYERLEQDIQHVERTLGGLDIFARMPGAKNGYRQDRRPAREVLSDRQKAIVQKRCREEFELMGYKP
jgi:hypothetical protein